MGPDPDTLSETGATPCGGEDVTSKESTSATWKWQLPLLSCLLLATYLHTHNFMCISEIQVIVSDRKAFITAN